MYFSLFYNCEIIFTKMLNISKTKNTYLINICQMKDYTQTDSHLIAYLKQELLFSRGTKRSFKSSFTFFIFFQVFLKPCSHVISCQQVEVEPLSADDWEILVKKIQWELFQFKIKVLQNINAFRFLWVSLYILSWFKL